MSVINTNVKALAAQGSLSNVNNKLAVSMERLSTGLRINSAKDDAAGLAITNRMTSDIRGFAVAIRNANDGLSMAQTAEGAIGQVTDMLQRMRELAVQSSNGSLNADNRAASQLEVAQLKAQIDDIAKQTNFNGIKLLDGSAGAVKLQTGVRAGELMTMSADSVQTKDIGLGSRASLTATGFSGTAGALGKSMSAGDLVLNGVTIRASSAADDLLSSGDKSSSAIAKAAAINASSAQTGVVAGLGNTTVGGTAMSGAGAAGGRQRGVGDEDAGRGHAVERGLVVGPDRVRGDQGRLRGGEAEQADHGDGDARHDQKSGLPGLYSDADRPGDHQNQADQQHGKQGVRRHIALEGLGQQVHEGGGQQRAGDVELEPFVAGLVQSGQRDPDDERTDREVDQEGQPPGHLGERAADDQAHHRADSGHRGEHRGGGARRRGYDGPRREQVVRRRRT